MGAMPFSIWVFISVAGSLFLLKALYGLSVAVVLPATRGALYVSTARRRVEAILEALDLQPGQLLVDLGCGDGRVLRSAVRRCALRAEGYEINPLAYGKARVLSLGCPRIRLHHDNFWNADLSAADIVFCYLFPDVMHPLACKLGRELKPGSMVASCNFPIPGWVPEKILYPAGRLGNDPVYFYRRPSAPVDPASGSGSEKVSS